MSTSSDDVTLSGVRWWAWRCRLAPAVHVDDVDVFCVFVSDVDAPAARLRHRLALLDCSVQEKAAAYKLDLDLDLS